MLREPVLEAAQRLLGSVVTTGKGPDRVSIALTEVEAYDGANDPASHAFNGRTARNSPMFDESGVLYVYRSYGIHWCMNVVTGPKGAASAVLLRGGTVIHGERLVVERRGRSDHLADGPGKLCQALDVSGDVSGTAIGQTVSLTLGRPVPPESILSTPRIGISKAQDRMWRFVSDVSVKPSGPAS
ncbi:MAG: DNA-3-methyladenine glycosylase [Acidimicrobiia bacterium]